MAQYQCHKLLLLSDDAAWGGEVEVEMGGRGEEPYWLSSFRLQKFLRISSLEITTEFSIRRRASRGTRQSPTSSGTRLLKKKRSISQAQVESSGTVLHHLLS